MKELFKELKKKIADGNATEKEKREYERLYVAVVLREQGRRKVTIMLDAAATEML